MLEAVRKRQIPIVGGGTGIWSFTEVTDAAAATVAATTCGPPGIYNVVDDDRGRVVIHDVADAGGPQVVAATVAAAASVTSVNDRSGAPPTIGIWSFTEVTDAAAATVAATTCGPLASTTSWMTTRPGRRPRRCRCQGGGCCGDGGGGGVGNLGERPDAGAPADDRLCRLRTACGVASEAVRKRQIPIVGGGTGIWSFTEVTDAAAATVAATTCGPPGIYNVVDDDRGRVVIHDVVDARGAAGCCGDGGGGSVGNLGERPDTDRRRGHRHLVVHRGYRRCRRHRRRNNLRPPLASTTSWMTTRPRSSSTTLSCQGGRRLLSET